MTMALPEKTNGMIRQRGLLRSIDLFADLGGFHLALKGLGHACALACEVNEELASLYEQNFGLRPHGDIRKLDISKVPGHDILCAGISLPAFLESRWTGRLQVSSVGRPL